MSELALKRTGGQARRFCNYGATARMYCPEDEWWPNMHQTGNASIPIHTKTSGSLLLRSNYGTGSSVVSYPNVYTTTIVLVPRIGNAANFNPSNGYWLPSIAVWLDNYEAECKTVKVPSIEVLYKGENVGTLELTCRIIDPGEALLGSENYGGVQVDWKFTKATGQTLSYPLQLYTYVDDISKETRK